jgi:positive regulator of sigma E activity
VKFCFNVGRVTLKRNFDYTNERSACEACSATKNFGTNSAVALGPRKNAENRDRVGRSPDLPYAK